MSQAAAGKHRKSRTATYFFLRGLAIILPPVLTLLILLWVGGGFAAYVVQPLHTIVRYGIAQAMYDARKADELETPPPQFPSLAGWRRNYRVLPELKESVQSSGTALTAEDLRSEANARQIFVPMSSGAAPKEYVPLDDYERVFEHLRPQPPPTTPTGLYMELAREHPLAWQLTLLALLLMIVGLYFLGRFVTARIGAWFVHKFELVLTRVPLVRNVYSTVKQVTDFVLSDREVEFKRVVALEYPRVGSWTLGFVTGEGIPECTAVVGEPMLTVLVPTSPVPAGGFTVIVPRSQVIDLNLSVDQAVQFVVSCGVLTPRPLGSPELVESAALAGAGSAEFVPAGLPGRPGIGNEP